MVNIGDVARVAGVSRSTASYALSGRRQDAIALMDRLTGFANDIGLLAEEYDVEHGRQMGNYPQAFSHLTLVRAADAIRKTGPA